MADEEKSAPEPANPSRRRWESIKICVLFVLCIAGLNLLRWWKPVDENVIKPFTSFIALVSEGIFAVLGHETKRAGTSVWMGDLSLNIAEECNGVPALLIFLAAVLAYSATWKQKLWGLLLGVPAIFVINEVRVITLFFAKKYGSDQIFELLHVYVWQTVIIIFSLLLWLYWAERFVRGARPKAPAPQS